MERIKCLKDKTGNCDDCPIMEIVKAGVRGNLPELAIGSQDYQLNCSNIESQPRLIQKGI
jgi:hypothetical protein